MMVGDGLYYLQNQNHILLLRALIGVEFKYCVVASPTSETSLLAVLLKIIT